MSARENLLVIEQQILSLSPIESEILKFIHNLFSVVSSCLLTATGKVKIKLNDWFIALQASYSVCLSHYKPASVCLSHYKPASVCLSHYKPASVCLSHYKPASVCLSHYKPASVCLSHYKPVDIFNTALLDLVTKFNIMYTEDTPLVYCGRFP